MTDDRMFRLRRVLVVAGIVLAVGLVVVGGGVEP